MRAAAGRPEQFMLSQVLAATPVAQHARYEALWSDETSFSDTAPLD